MYLQTLVSDLKYLLHMEALQLTFYAGIGPVDNFITDKFDSNGELLPPNMKTMEVNLNGPIYTSKLGIHYLRKNPAGGSVVITASASSFTPFEANDYGTAKHGTLGLMRNFTACLQGTNIRCNCITPLWTASGLVPAAAMKEMLGITSQPPEAAARSALICMADKERNGQAIYSRRGEFKEVNSILMGAMFPAMDVAPEDMPADEAAKEKFSAFFKPQTYNEQYGHN
jgi:NAD(P)-dependent dehydrogenase (short-subunit alcohol dehydrogenase family)